MKETVRVLLRGDVDVLRTEWERHFPWPFCDVQVAVIPSDSPQLTFLREYVKQHPELRAAEFVERKYSKRELLQFPGFVLWENCDVDSEKGEGLQYGEPCTGCGFPAWRRRVEPFRMTRSKCPRKDFATNSDLDTIVSARIVTAWQEAGLTGATFGPVTVNGVEGEFFTLHITGNLPHELPGTLRYDGERCAVCGRYDMMYPLHPSKELWIPERLWIDTDIAMLGVNLVRRFTTRTLISHRAYFLLLKLKATGFWVQPVHLVSDAGDELSVQGRD